MGIDWLATLGGAANGAYDAMGRVRTSLDRAADIKRSEARYEDEKAWRQTELEAQLAERGLFPDNGDGVDQPDKGVLAIGRPPLASILANAAAAPTPSLMKGVRPSMATPQGFTIDRPASLVDPSSIAPKGVAALAPSSSSNPVRSSLDAASRPVTIGGKPYTFDDTRTPEGRRANAQLQKEQQRASAQQAERRSALKTLRNSNPTKYAELSDELIDAASRDDALYNKIVSPNEARWQTIQTDGGFVQVNPDTGETRPLSDAGGHQLHPKPPRDSGAGSGDRAIVHRGVFVSKQLADVNAEIRAAEKLTQYKPRDKAPPEQKAAYETARTNLVVLKQKADSLRGVLSDIGSQFTGAEGAASEDPTAQLSDAQAWEYYVHHGMAKAAATAKVQARHGGK